MSTGASVSVRPGGSVGTSGSNGSDEGGGTTPTPDAAADTAVDNNPPRMDARTDPDVSDARSATIVLAAATSFRRYDDVSGDPSSLNRATLTAVAGKTFEALHESDPRINNAIDAARSFAGGILQPERQRINVELLADVFDDAFDRERRVR